MPRILGLFLLASLLTACASHRPVKVNCSGHLVRINAPSASMRTEPPPAASSKPSQAPQETPPAEEDSPQ